jgi:hypothetical protein
MLRPVTARRHLLRKRLHGAALGAGLVAAGAVGAGAPETRAYADEAQGTAEAVPPPAPPRRAYIQYGVAAAVEGVAHAGPVCGNDATPCILGSGGGIDISVGWRPTEDFYLGGSYEFSKQDPNKLLRLATLQQVRVASRLYFPTGKSAQPFVLFALGLAGYGNEWSVATWGPSATLGGGLEVELSAGLVFNVSVAYRPIYFRSFTDSSPAFHEAGVAHFITVELALEAQDTL